MTMPTTALITEVFLIVAFLILQAQGCLPGSTSGSCGAVSGCAGPSYPTASCGGGCAPSAPSAPSCGCSTGQACGSYGCYNVHRNKQVVEAARIEEVLENGTALGKVKGSASETIQRYLQLGKTVTYIGPGSGATELLSNKGLVSINDNSSLSSALMQHEPLPKPLTPNDRFMTCCIGRKLPDACVDHCTFESYTRESLSKMYLKQDKCPVYAAAEIHFCAAQGQDHSDCCVKNGVASTLGGQRCLVFCDQTPGRFAQLDATHMACFDRFDTIKSCFLRGIREKPKSARALQLF